jgi:cobalamin-dependent methionine synthase I
VLIGTVKGDLHDIGKNMVVTMLKGVGFEMHDLGINMDAAVFIREAERLKPDILGISALLTTTMPQMKTVIDGLSPAGSGIREGHGGRGAGERKIRPRYRRGRLRRGCRLHGGLGENTAAPMSGQIASVG